MKKKHTAVNTNLLSIDIGSYCVKIAAGQKSGDRIKITALAKKELPEGVYENGRIQDPLTLKTILQGLIRDNHIKQKDVAITYEGNDIIKRDLIVPKVDDKDQLELITYEVSQYLPIDIENYILQYKEIEEIEEDNTIKLKILLGAIPKDLVRTLYDFIIDCGLNPVFMDVHSNSLEKFVEFGLDSIASTKTIAVVEIGHKLIDISIFEKGMYKFNRLLKMGAADFDKILVNHLDLPAEEIFHRKKMTHLSKLRTLNDSDENTSNNESSLMATEILNCLEDCLNEVDKVFKYYTYRGPEHFIDTIYLTGGGAQLKDLSMIFREKFEIDTQVVNSYSGIEIATKKLVDELPIYVNAVGALIRK